MRSCSLKIFSQNFCHTTNCASAHCQKQTQIPLTPQRVKCSPISNCPNSLIFQTEFQVSSTSNDTKFTSRSENRERAFSAFWHHREKPRSREERELIRAQWGSNYWTLRVIEVIPHSVCSFVFLRPPSPLPATSHNRVCANKKAASKNRRGWLSYNPNEHW